MFSVKCCGHRDAVKQRLFFTPVPPPSHAHPLKSLLMLCFSYNYSQMQHDVKSAGKEICDVRSERPLTDILSGFQTSKYVLMSRKKVKIKSGLNTLHVIKMGSQTLFC